MKKNKKKEAIVGIILFIGGILIFILINFFVQKFDFKKNGKYSIAEIYDFHVLAKSGHSICFKFSINNQQFKSCQFETFSNSTLRLMLLGKKFPVIYNPEKPGECEILITEYDFKEFGLEYPDSLYWVEENRSK
jgi:hypothetical protein